MTISQRNVKTRRAQGHVGQLVSSSRLNRCTTLLNNAPQAAQVDDVTVDTAADSTTYTYSVNGFEVSYTSGTGATKQSIAEGLAARHNANIFIRGQVSAALEGTDKVRLTGENPGIAFTLAESDGNLSTASVTSPAEADEIPFGRLLISTGYLEAKGTQTGSEFNELCALPKSTALAARVVVLTPTAENASIYHLILEVEGKIYDCSYTSDADATVQEIVEGWAAKVNAAMPANTVAATEDDAALTLTAEVKGKHFEYTAWAEGTGTAAIAVTSDSDPLEADIHRVAAGISVRRYDQAATNIPGTQAVYQPNEGVEALEDGSIWVASSESITRADNVYVETDPNSSPGTFYNTSSSTRIKFSLASWMRIARGDEEIAALKFKRAS